MFKIFKFIFIPAINRLLSRSLRPFAKIIPTRYQFPVVGFFNVTTDNKKKLLIEGHYTCYVTKLLFWRGYRGYEYDTIHIFVSLLNEAKVFFDIGANVGYYSLLAAQQNNDLSIYAFEPLPDAYKAMERNVAANHFKNVHTEQIALSDREGKQKFYYAINKDFPDAAFQLAGDNSLVDYDEVERVHIEVQTTTLDNYVKEKDIQRIDLIKIDTETTEHLILKNGVNAISKFQPVIICEVIKGHNEKDLEEFLKPLGYIFFKVEPAGLQEVSSLTGQEEVKNEYFLVPEDKKQPLKSFII